MKLLQNILVTTDFSDSSANAVDVSIQLAKKFNSKISLIHVLDDSDFSKESEEFYEKFAFEKLGEHKSKIENENVVVADLIFEKGVPFEKIIQVAQDKDVNVIIAGSGNKDYEEKYRLGTSVEKLMRKNQIPLWVVKNEKPVPLKQIVCPVDFSDASKRALQNAITLANKFEAKLDIVHVFEPVMVTSARLSVDTNEENRKNRKSKEKQLTEFLRQFDLEKVQHNENLIMGDPFIEILKFIRTGGIDLLVMGTTGKAALSRLLMGSVTEKVTREVPCSFITTKAKDITDDYLESNLKGIESILNPGKILLKKGKYDQAIERFTIGLKQYPDNIPMLNGIIEAYSALEDDKKANYYKEYKKEVVKRIWGEDYLSKIG